MFVRRELDITFNLGEGAFGDSGFNTVKLTGLRASAQIKKAGGPSMGSMQLQVYGMTLSTMNKLSTLGIVWTLVRKNTVIVEAGDEGGAKTTVFIGTIQNAWADMQSAPDVVFRVDAFTGLLEAVATSEPSSYTGSTDAALIMASLATKMGLPFENNGVSVKLPSPYFYGSPRNQAKACAEQGNFNWIIDDARLAIWPKGGKRGGVAPLISKETGMKGYPTYTSKGIIVETLFNPSVGYGAPINVKSLFDAATGTWIVYSLDHDLDAAVPHGKWFTTIGATQQGLVVVS